MLAAIANQLDKTLRPMCLRRSCKQYSLCANPSHYTISVRWLEEAQDLYWTSCLRQHSPQSGFANFVWIENPSKPPVESVGGQNTSLPRSPGYPREVASWALA